MRTSADRVRHTILFEVIGVFVCTPLAAWILDRAIAQVGSLSIVLSLTAMGMNYVYNLLFDMALIRTGRPVNVRPAWLRAIHAILFEASLIILTVPMIAWWLEMPLLAAFLTDIGFTVFFLVYAFFYNWAYDTVFPIPA